MIDWLAKAGTGWLEEDVAGSAFRVESQISEDVLLRALITCVWQICQRKSFESLRNQEAKGHSMEFLHPQKPLPWECGHRIDPFMSSVSTVILNVCSCLSLDVFL
ncbi:hypothetical protein llap_14520 [Limosa lapponica baueri]|uniref:Uncharacterized protein n=1 Tax=Limosa lapponica baueri TaxID=1758121 RepID=A0A2I0TN04_LIMLA|nr:hypothetical protein llap_14520 [Limosa lapponica baueri]